MLHRKKRLLIIECIPKWEDKNEGLILYEFLKLTFPIYVPLPPKRKSSKHALITYLNNKKKDLDKFEYVHLSGHGARSSKDLIQKLLGPEECAFRTPRGRLKPEEFPKDCFAGKTITLSACTLGKGDFVRDFVAQTGAKHVIAPMKSPHYADAGIWFVNFYYHVLRKNKPPYTAYKRTERTLKGVGGAFQFWEF